MTSINPEGHFARWQQLIESAPANWEQRSRDPDVRRWLGQVTALAGLDVGSADAALLSSVLPSFHSIYEREHEPAKNQIWDIIYRQLAKAELKAPPAQQGGFILARSEFDAYSAIANVLERATSDLLIVDPYLDAQFLTKFAVSAIHTTRIRLLADVSCVKPSLKPSVEAWINQYGAERPLEARLTTARTLHDRTIIVDGTSSYILTQSFNAFAARSHASIARADEEIAKLKIPAYEAIWNSSSSL